MSDKVRTATYGELKANVKEAVSNFQTVKAATRDLANGILQTLTGRDDEQAIKILSNTNKSMANVCALEKIYHEKVAPVVKALVQGKADANEVAIESALEHARITGYVTILLEKTSEVLQELQTTVEGIK